MIPDALLPPTTSICHQSLIIWLGGVGDWTKTDFGAKEYFAYFTCYLMFTINDRGPIFSIMDTTMKWTCAGDNTPGLHILPRLVRKNDCPLCKGAKYRWIWRIYPLDKPLYNLKHFSADSPFCPGSGVTSLKSSEFIHHPVSFNNLNDAMIWMPHIHLINIYEHLLWGRHHAYK